MRSFIQQKRQQGFTIVELLIVIVVIGILAALVIVTFSGIQQRARNTERKTDINAIQGHLEAYYTDTGTYPTLAMILNDDWRAVHMDGLPEDALDDPSGDRIAATAGDNDYTYVAKAGGLTCPDATGTGAAMESTCDEYTLTAAQEGDDDYVKSNN